MALEFKGIPIHTRKLKGKECFYAKAKVYCFCCGKAIPGTRTASRNAAGKFTTLQTFVPDDKAAHPLKAGGKRYICGGPKCTELAAEKAKPTTKGKAKEIQLAPPQEAHEAEVITVRGPSGQTFTQKGEDFFYHGFKIVDSYVEGRHTCQKCQGTIITKAYVTFKDGKPAYVNKQTVLGAPAKCTKGPKGQWQHTGDCPAAPVEAHEEVVEETETPSRSLFKELRESIEEFSEEQPLGLTPPTEEMETRHQQLIQVIEAENAALRVEIDRLNQETAGALELAVELEKQLNETKEQLAAAQDLLKQARMQLGKGAPLPAGSTSLLVAGKPHQDLEKMALDTTNYSDKAVRGASWMLMRAIQGGAR